MFARPNDFEITLTCVNDKGFPCNGNKVNFNNKSMVLATNNIEVDEIQYYTLNIIYQNFNVDQSIDMNKTLSLKLKIYNEKEIADINGIINGVNENYLVKLESEPKLSTITKTDKGYEFSFTGVKTGIHTLSVINKEGEVLSSQKLSIELGNATNIGTSIVDGKTIPALTLTKEAKVANLTTNVVIGESGNSVNNVVNSIMTYNPYDYNTNLLSYKIINNAVLAKNQNSNKTIYNNEPLSVPAYEISKSTENILTSDYDDYGITYYYRGNVSDNYVNFAGMCWRIVRIIGDGSIRLILEDRNATCDSDSYSGNWTLPMVVEGETFVTGNFGYTKHASKSLTASDGVYKNSGYRQFVEFTNPKTAIERSKPLVFKQFQTSFTNEQLEKLQSGNWCTSNNEYLKDADNYIFTPITNIEAFDNKLHAKTVYYDAGVRLRFLDEVNYSATFNCNGKVLSDWEDETKTPMYVGTITADEVMFAGGGYGLDNTNYYLLNQSFKNDSIGTGVGYFWTMTPAYFTKQFDRSFVVDTVGALANDQASVIGSGAFRPSINLKASTESLEGAGTKLDPYEIN